MPGPFSRAAPFPYDCTLDPGDGLGPVGLMLVPGEEGLLVARSEESLGNVAPTAYGYASQDPTVETTFEFGRLTGGMGESVQGSGPARRYRYALDVDCSIAGMPRLGPAFEDEAFPGIRAPAFAGDPLEVRQFVTALHGSTRTLFALVDQYVYARIAGTWTLSKDFGAADEPMQAVEFQGTTGSGGLWVATILGELWLYDGAAWTQATLPAAVPPDPAAFAERVEVVGGELYIGSGWEVRKATADPLLAASWSGSIKVGHQATRISGLRAVGNTLFVFKWDGIYTLNADASDNDLFPEMRSQQRVSNGRTAVPWKDALWFAFGDGFYRMDAGASLEAIGPERLVDLDPAIRGQSVSAAGHADWFLYLATYNAGVNTSYLLKYGTWANADQESGFEFLDAWHGAVAHWVGKRITRVDVIEFDAEHDPTADGPRLWVGFDDGTVAYAELPVRTPDPAADDRCVPAGTLVEPDGAVLAASRRYYTGDLVRVTTARGHHLAGTPNHPVLTPTGWRPLGLLNEGDDVISRRLAGQGSTAAPGPDVDDGDTPIEEVFGLASIAGSKKRVRGRAQDFHGDGQDTDVEVVWPHGLLQDRPETAIGEHRSQLALACTDEGERVLARARDCGDAARRRTDAAHSGVRILRPRATLLEAGRRHPQHHRLLSGSQGDAGTDEAATHAGRGDAQFRGERGGGLAGQVAPDEIVRVDRVPFAGHVYNLETENHRYVAGGIVTHNCRFVTQGDLYWPLHHAGYPVTVKSFHGFAAVGPALSASLTAEQFYRPTPVAAYQSIGTAFAASGQRVAVPAAQTGVTLDAFTRLATTTDTLTPVLEHVALFEAIRPHADALRLSWSFTARAADRVGRRDGVPSPVPASRVRAALRAAAADPAAVSVTLPDETVASLEALSYRESLAPDERRVGLDHAVAVRFSQLA